tara:strand:+ start:121 stop:297 length:177 start_codon:yes stop_codon:yes gene_type:complete
MLRLSEVSVDELKRMRWFLLFRYNDCKSTDPKHQRYGNEFNKVSRELNRRTGETKYKA